MNKRKKKKVLEWWKSLRLDEKDDLIKICVNKDKTFRNEFTDHQLEKMFDWVKN